MQESNVAATFFGIMAVLGFIEGIIAIIASALCCHGCCSRSGPQVFILFIKIIYINADKPYSLSYVSWLPLFLIVKTIQKCYVSVKKKYWFGNGIQAAAKFKFTVKPFG